MTPRPWFNHYTEGVGHTIDADQYPSLNQFFESILKRYAERPAFTSFGKTMSYRDLQVAADKFAHYLVNTCGLQKGDRIAIQMPNLLQYPICVIGALKAGLTIVNTNPLYTPREMEYQFRDAGVRAVVILENFASKLSQILPQVPGIEVVILATMGDMLGSLKGRIMNVVVRSVKRMVPKYNLPGAIRFRDITAKPGLDFQQVPVGSDDLAFIQYTGGTTGASKGAMLTHRNLLANATQHHIWLRHLLKEGTEVVITALPMYHIFALTVNFITFFRIGAENILIANPRDIKSFIGTIRKRPFSIITGVNTLFKAMIHHPDFSKVDFSKLKLSIGGGMAVQKSVADKWKAHTGVLLMEGYGLTECSPVVTIHPFDGKERIGTIGIPLPDTDVIICNDAGEPMPTGEKGEICVKGPQVMKGYWNDEKESQNAFIGRYVRTGDIGYMDRNGFFYIVDRKKEMINVSGFNVYPREIEDVIASHPKVLEAGVKGILDGGSGEVPQAYIVKKDESLTEGEVRAYCVEHLTSYKVPKYYVFRSSLPKTNIGKILRKELS
jgi:long-chain acyl-CoA synthetase